MGPAYHKGVPLLGVPENPIDLGGGGWPFQQYVGNFFPIILRVSNSKTRNMKKNSQDSHLPRRKLTKALKV